MLISRRVWLAGSAALLGAVSPRGARAQAPPGQPVRIATTAAETYAQPFFAQEAGLFAKAGVTAEIVQLATGAAVSTAIAGGAGDVGVTSTVTLGNAIIRDVPFVAIAPCALTTAKAPAGVLCVAKSSAYKTPKDFEGKTIAVPSLKQAADLAVRAWLAAGGADITKVRIIEMPFVEMGEGLERGLVAAASISDPALTNQLKRNDIRRFADPFAAIGPNHMVAAWFTTRQYLQANPDLVRRVAAALTEAGRWANAHQNESAAIVARVSKVDIDVIRSENRTVFGEQLRASDLQPQLDAAFKQGFLTRAVSASEFLPRS
jgi:NitT/TauT family transport system substrate-binding protein